MKTILKSALLATALSCTTLMAGVVFDLGAQQLYYCVTDIENDDGTTSNQYVEASYNTTYAVVSTGLVSDAGEYRPPNQRSGHFGVRIKSPKKTTAVNFSMYCYLYNDGCSVELLGRYGKAVNINFAYKEIAVNGKKQTDDEYSGQQNINGTIEINSTQLLITINGSHTFVVKRSNFYLEKVNVSLFTDVSNSTYKIDKLHSLTISNH